MKLGKRIPASVQERPHVLITKEVCLSPVGKSGSGRYQERKGASVNVSEGRGYLE